MKLRIPDKNDPNDVSSFLLKNIDSGSKPNNNKPAENNEKKQYDNIIIETVDNFIKELQEEKPYN